MWAVTTGRYIVILTELVVIIAFFSRFKLDSDLSNLNEEITGKKQVLDAQINIENKFLSVQSRLNKADIYLGQQMKFGEMMGSLVQKIPAQVKLTSMDVKDGKVLLAAEAPNETAMGEMLKRMGKVTLTSVAANTKDGVKFSVTYATRL